MKDIIKGITKLIFKIIRFVLSYYFQMFFNLPTCLYYPNYHCYPRLDLITTTKIKF